MSTTAVPFTLTCSGRVELPEDDPVFGTYWMEIDVEAGIASTIGHAIVLAEHRARDPDFRYLSPSRFRFDPAHILVRDALKRLILGGRFVPEGIVWSTPVGSDEEAASVRRDARDLNDRGSFEHGWDNYSTARSLWKRAALLETRLVDPHWRTEALAALHDHSHEKVNVPTNW